MGKYDPLSRWLDRQDASEITVDFDDIEAILGDELPQSARVQEVWWSGTPPTSSPRHPLRFTVRAGGGRRWPRWCRWR
jgi:hypothetical protein